MYPQEINNKIQHYKLHLHLTFLDLTRYFKKVYHSYESPIVDWFGPIPMYYVKEPEEASIMFTHPKLVQKSKFMYKSMKWLLGNSVITNFNGKLNYEIELVCK